jgi:hypothetical protein
VKNGKNVKIFHNFRPPVNRLVYPPQPVVLFRTTVAAPTPQSQSPPFAKWVKQNGGGKGGISMTFY